MKFTLLSIYSIGIVVCILIGLGIYMMSITPTSYEITYLNEYIEKANREISKKKAVDKRLVETQELVAVESDKWAVNRRQHGLPTSYVDFSKPRIDMAVQAWQLPAKIGNDINKFAKAGKVIVVSSPSVTGFIDNPNEIVEVQFNGTQQPFLIRQLSDKYRLAVTGTFSNVLEHYRRWNNVPKYLVLCDNLTLVGTDLGALLSEDALRELGFIPTVTAAYDTTIFVIPEGTVNQKSVPHIPKLAGQEGQQGSQTGGGGTAMIRRGAGAPPAGGGNSAPITPGASTGPADGADSDSGMQGSARNRDNQ